MLAAAIITGLRLARDRRAGCRTERVIHAVEDGIWLANQIYNKALLREEAIDNRRYSAAPFVSSEKKIVMGRPDIDLISTSYIERLNATTRLHVRRLTRLTLALSKKRENFEAAVGRT